MRSLPERTRLPLLAVLVLAGVPLRPAHGTTAPPSGGHAAGYESITSRELTEDLRYLSSPELEGRDTPSVGLEVAAAYIARRFEAAGLLPAPDSAQVWQDLHGKPLDPSAAPGSTTTQGTYLRPWQRTLPAPDAASKLVLAATGGEQRFELGVDFVPVRGMEGAARGALVFAGFGIDAKSERYSDLDGLKVRGKVALVVGGEPAHAKAFDGPEVSPAAALWRKVDALAQAGAAAILVVRRPAPVKGHEKKKAAPVAPAAPGTTAAAERFGFRHTWADWVGAPDDPAAKNKLPVLEVSAACGEKLLGEDVLALAGRIERALKPVRLKDGAEVALESRTREEALAIDNVVGYVRGSDLAEEHVVLGAHYDHVGVDERGRIGCGADDNASGTAGLIEIAEAIARSGPRRSVWFCAFSGEEDGLLGSKALCERLPVPKEHIVAMINMDMIGRGDASEVAVLGLHQNPGFEKTLNKARTLKPCGIQKLVVRQGEELFQRSDHYAFHKLGIPVLFFFEGLPIDRNKDYHTWRDTFEEVDQEKVFNTTRIVFHTTWLISTDDDRPPAPRD